jgi:Flp pilus assembly pilin Flp
MTFKQFVSQFLREESGQDMLEYAMVLLAVLAAVVAGTTTLATTISTELTKIDGGIAALPLP